MTDDAREQFAAFNVAVPEPVEPENEDEAEEIIDVWAENFPIVEAFLALATQWKCVAVSGFSGGRVLWTGLDYAAVDIVLRRYGLGKGRKPLDALGVMEDAALAVMNGAGR